MAIESEATRLVLELRACVFVCLNACLFVLSISTVVRASLFVVCSSELDT